MTVRTVLATSRDERLRPPAIGVAAACAVAAVVVELSLSPSPLRVAVVLGAAVVVGELLILRWPPAGELPLSYAVFLVVARAVPLRDAMATLLIAELVSLAGDERTHRAVWRAGRGLAAGVATVCTFHLAFAALGRHEIVAIVVAALLVAAMVASAVDGSLRRAEHEILQTFWPERALYAWGAVVGSGVLMAIAVRGVDGDGALGTRGAGLLALPLLAVWWSFQQDDASARVLRQTVDALAMVPVLTGVVDIGASARDAETARRVGAHVGLTPDEQHTIAVAARLRHVGAAAAEPRIDLTHARPTPVAQGRVEQATSEMLRDTPFADAGAVVRATRSVAVRDDAAGNGRVELSATVLHVVSEYQSARARGRDSATALGALRARYADRRVTAVVDVLERLTVAGELY